MSSPFVAHVRAGRGAACRFLPVLPQSEAAWSEAVDAARRASTPVPSALAQDLARRQEELGAGPRSLRNARALAEPGTLAVVTGQQPGLLGGLLLTFHKAAGAMHLARRLDGQGGGRVVPVFWLASEDHDFDEANRLFLLDRAGRPRRLSLPRSADGRSLMHIDVGDDEVGSLLAAAATLLPDTDRAREALALVARSEGRDFATWGGAALLHLLGDGGLVLLEPSVVTPFAGDALARLAEEAGVIRSALRETAQMLLEAGLPAPLDVGDDHVPLFLRAEATGPRRRWVEGPEGWLGPRDGGPRRTVEETTAFLRRHPELGSGDVTGRVLIQDALLPVLAYVAGPTELAYHAQVKAAHEAVGLRYPLAVPRPEATWVDAKSERIAASFGREVAELLAEGMSTSPPPHLGADAAALETSLDEWRTSTTVVPDALETWAEGTGERRAALERARARVEATLRRAAEDLGAVFARERGVDAGSWARLASVLGPRGRPQERGLSAVSVVARYGVEAFRAGLGGLDPLAEGHHLVHLGGDGGSCCPSP